MAGTEWNFPVFGPAGKGAQLSVFLLLTLTGRLWQISTIFAVDAARKRLREGGMYGF